jgi:glutathione synthase/RimK-type ligase-like ATP-grasp enzyme
MKKLGISSCLIDNSNGFSLSHSYELQSLHDEGSRLYDRVVLIDPIQVTYLFDRSEDKPIIFYHNETISDLTSLIVRGTKGCETSIAILVNSLKNCGCDVLDPPDRFSGVRASKLLTTLDRHQEKIGTDSYYAFTYETAITLVNRLYESNKFPLVAKPIDGSKGMNVRKLDNPQDAIEYITQFFKRKASVDSPLFLQQFIAFVAEYRAFVIGGTCVGLARKIAQSDSFILNAAQGGAFFVAEDQNIISFIEEHVSKEGILGVDVAVDSKGNIHIIEANRAPLWKEFERATGINVAQRIIQYAYGRLSE